MPDMNSVLVEQRRGNFVESSHRGAAVVVDADNRIIRSLGNVEQPILVNSALKLVQALPFIASGAAERWKCSDAEIALAASSQIGQEFQRNALKAWAARLGLPHTSVQCGAIEPHDRGARNALIRLGKQTTVFHGNNAGKHLAVLATALHLGEPLDGYLRTDHPAQVRIRRAVASAAGMDELPADGPFDRCGMPSIPISLRQLATASVRIGTGERLDAALSAAATRLVAAIRNEPTYLVGPDRLSTRICQITNGRVILKGGNEGAYTGVDAARGRGYAVKIDDGALRAADVAIIGLLIADCALECKELDAISKYASVPLKNGSGSEIGILTSTTAMHG
jgi:L-asparaginase II